MIAILLLNSNHVFAQNIPISNFYDKYKYEENTTKISLPGWIIKLGAVIAVKVTEKEEDKEAIKLAKKLRYFKLLQIEDSNPVAIKDIKRLTRKLERRNYEPLLFIRDGTSRTQVMVKEKRGFIKRFFLIYQDDESFTMLSIKSKIHFKDINKVIRLLSDEHDIPIASAPTPAP